MVNSIYYSNSKINPNYLNPNKNGYRNLSTPSFKSQLEADTVTLSTDDENQKKKLSKGAKWGIAIGLTALAGLGARFGLQRVIKNSYNKWNVVELSENMVFKKATTKEEALKFLKENLKIENVEDTISLEELNYITKNLVDVSNAHKGKCVMPNAIKYFDDLQLELHKDIVAGIDVTSGSKNTGSLYINKKFFESKNLDDELKHWDPKMKPGSIYAIDGKKSKIYAKLDDNIADLYNKYLKSPQDLSLEEKLSLLESFKFYNNTKYNLLNGISISSNNVRDNNLLFLIKKHEGHSILHEMGHLQDQYAKKDSHISRPFKTEFNWRRETFKLSPDKINKEFKNNKASQETAGKVSNYSKTSIEEFIAETYAELISGQKLSDDIIALYKKYGGPEVF